MKPETRTKLVEVFRLKRANYVEVFDGKVLEDGYSASLPDITVEKLQEALGSKDEDFYKLFYKMVDKLEGREEEIKKPLADPLQVEEVLKEKNGKIDKRTKEYKEAKAKGLI